MAAGVGGSAGIPLKALACDEGGGPQPPPVAPPQAEAFLRSYQPPPDTRFYAGVDRHARSHFLQLEAGGASDVTAPGAAARLDFDCSGASRGHATKLTAQTVVADVSGTATAEVHAVKALQANASGASTGRYEGSPPRVKQSSNGASTISQQ
jgi:hypothetical protein